MRKLLCLSGFIIIILQFIMLSAVSAQTPEITNGLNYLTSTQNPDGSWGDGTSSVEVLPATVSVIETLQVFEQTGTLNYTNAISWLQSQSLETTDYLSERIHALSDGGTDIDVLLSSLDEIYSGTWGGYIDFEANNLDTALAVLALNEINHPDLETISYALGYLTGNQNADGGWGFYEGDESNVYMAAMVLKVLASYNGTFDLQAEIDSAVAYLLTNQNADGGFGSDTATVYETALAFEALIASGSLGAENSAVMQDAIDYLLTSQQPDGSWDQNPYSTALALGH